MKMLISTVATAALIALSTVPVNAQAMDEMTMVVETATHLLIDLGLPTDGIMNLTAAQIRDIISIADSHEMGDAARVRVQKILGE